MDGRHQSHHERFSFLLLRIYCCGVGRRILTKGSSSMNETTTRRTTTTSNNGDKNNSNKSQRGQGQRLGRTSTGPVSLFSSLRLLHLIYVVCFGVLLIRVFSTTLPTRGRRIRIQWLSISSTVCSLGSKGLKWGNLKSVYCDVCV